MPRLWKDRWQTLRNRTNAFSHPRMHRRPKPKGNVRWPQKGAPPRRHDSRRKVIHAIRISPNRFRETLQTYRATNFRSRRQQEKRGGAENCGKIAARKLPQVSREVQIIIAANIWIETSTISSILTGKQACSLSNARKLLIGRRWRMRKSLKDAPYSVEIFRKSKKKCNKRSAHTYNIYTRWWLGRVVFMYMILFSTFRQGFDSVDVHDRKVVKSNKDASSTHPWDADDRG